MHSRDRAGMAGNSTEAMALARASGGTEAVKLAMAMKKHNLGDKRSQEIATEMLGAMCALLVHWLLTFFADIVLIHLLGKAWRGRPPISRRSRRR